MCGRYALTLDPETLFDVFDARPDDRAGGAAGLYGGDPVRPRYNIGPTVTVPVVRLARPRPADEGGPDDREPGCDGRPDGSDRPAREVEPMRWGLVPSWAKDVSVGNRQFNARAETLASKPAFRRALERRRCLIPATGYYEWRKLTGPDVRAGAKQAYFFTPKDGSTMALAGLWEYWKSPEGEGLVSMTIITVDAVGPLREIHDRMPLILPASEWDAWLDSDVDPAQLLSPPSAELVDALEIRPVGAAVGNVRNDGPELLTAVPDAAGGPDVVTPAEPGTRPEPVPAEQPALFNPA